MQYKVNPFSKNALLHLARERLVVPSPHASVGLSAQEVQRLLESLAIHRIELEIQNEYLQESYVRVQMALGRARNLYDFAPIACCSTSNQGFITTANLTGSALLGMERSGLINQLFEVFFPDDQRPQIRTLMTRALATGKSQRCELSLLAPHALCQLVQIDLGALAKGDGLQIVLTDVTARRATENRLREDTQRWKFALDAVGDSVCDWNLLTGAVRYTRQIKQLLGYELQELGDSIDIWRALVHPDNQACFVKSVQQCLSGQSARLE